MDLGKHVHLMLTTEPLKSHPPFGFKNGLCTISLLKMRVGIHIPPASLSEKEMYEIALVPVID